MSGLPYDEHFEQLAAGYFDEVLDEAQQAEFKALLQEDDRRVKRFAELAQLHQMIESEIAYRQQAERFGLNRSPNDGGAASAMAELASLYEDSLQPPMDFAAWREEQVSRAKAQEQRVLRRRVLVGGVAFAALFALVGMLAVVLSHSDVPETPITKRVTEDQTAGPAKRAVAMLTAADQTLWDTSGGKTAPTPGDTLYAGQHLALIDGFAEMTTNRGAVVILESPATVELLDNDNALHLHRGKLVGFCHTDSSKGFVVQTPGARITDIGTEFGVYVADNDVTQVHVFEGEIVLKRNHQRAIAVKHGEAYQFSHDAARLTAIQAQPQQFASDVSGLSYQAIQRYASSVEAQRPLAYYRFEEIGPDGRVLNEVGQNDHGRVIDAVTTENTGVGNAAVFSGGYIELDQAASELSGATSYTFECWVLTNRIHDGSVLTLTSRPDDASEAELVAGALSFHRQSDAISLKSQSQRFRFLHRNPPGSSILQGTRVISRQAYQTRQWMHVAAVKDGPSMKLYINGELNSVGTDDSALFDRELTVRIGANTVLAGPKDDKRFFDGMIDELAIYDKALTAETIRQHYELLKGRNNF
ncbi:MAG: FecR domain-containing protein [Phycisphaeraceae bacterium]|nr:FecR domain-containing protein [Phycisphaeraceae bacterium]